MFGTSFNDIGFKVCGDGIEMVFDRGEDAQDVFLNAAGSALLEGAARVTDCCCLTESEGIL